MNNNDKIVKFHTTRFNGELEKVMHYCCEKNYLTSFILLNELDLEITKTKHKDLSKFIQSAALSSSTNNNTIEFIINHSKMYNYDYQRDMNQALISSAAYGNLNSVKFLISKNAKVSPYAIDMASKYGYRDIVTYLMKFRK